MQVVWEEGLAGVYIGGLAFWRIFVLAAKMAMMNLIITLRLRSCAYVLLSY